MLNAHDVRRVAVAAGCDPRTVLRYLRGKTIQSTSAARIAGALRELGIQAAPATDETPSGPAVH